MNRMKKCSFILRMLVSLMCLVILAGCANTKQAAVPTAPKSVAQVGQLPDKFIHIVENNLFDGVVAFENRLLKAEVVEADKEHRTVTHRIQMMDLYGNHLAAYLCNSDEAYHVDTLTATQDDGFLFVLGFSDRAYDGGTWASDNGFASRIIKCDKNGKLQFDTPLDGVEGWALQYCFEVNERFCFFGTKETTETKIKGVGSPSDIYMIILDRTGTVVNMQSIAGTDFDSLDAAEMTGNGFLLSISAQSDDGDFAGSRSNGYPKDWVFTVDYDLKITGRKMKTGRDYFDNRLGEKNGITIYKSNCPLTGLDAGTPNAFIDYGDFYLIVSSNNTGVYEKTPPMINSIWYYTECVYSAYDYNGKLLFRASVDSSPDYDALAQSFFVTPYNSTV